MSLESLPEDIYLHIFSFLDMNDVYNVTMGSKQLQTYFNSEHLWLSYIRENYPHIERYCFIENDFDNIHYLSWKSIVRLIKYFKEISYFEPKVGIHPYVLQGINFIEYDPKYFQYVMKDIMILYTLITKTAYVAIDTLKFYMKYTEVFKFLFLYTSKYEKRVLYNNEILNHAIRINDALAVEYILENTYSCFVGFENNYNPLIAPISHKKYNIVKLILEKSKSGEINYDAFGRALLLAFKSEDKRIIELMIKHKFFHPWDLSNISYIKDNLDILKTILDHPEFNNNTDKKKQKVMCIITTILFSYACEDVNSSLFNLLINHPKIDPSLGSEFFIKHDLDLGYVLNHNLGLKGAHALVYHAVINNNIKLVNALTQNFKIDFNKIDLVSLLMNMKGDCHEAFKLIRHRISSFKTLESSESLYMRKPGCMKLIFTLNESRRGFTLDISRILHALCSIGTIESYNIFKELNFDMDTLNKEHFICSVLASNEVMALRLYQLEHIKDSCNSDHKVLKTIIKSGLPRLFKEYIKQTNVWGLKGIVMTERQSWTSWTYYTLVKDPRFNVVKYCLEMLYKAVNDGNVKLIKHLLTNTRYSSQIGMNAFLDYCDKQLDPQLDILVRDTIYNKIRYTGESKCSDEHKVLIKEILSQYKLSLSKEEYSNIKSVRRISIWLEQHVNKDFKIRDASFFFDMELRALQCKDHETICRKILGDSLYNQYCEKYNECHIYDDAYILNTLGARNIIKMMQEGKIDMKNEITKESIPGPLGGWYFHTDKAYEEALVKYTYAIRLLNRYKNTLNNDYIRIIPMLTL